ncbi:MAG: DUF5011 domain-containing protein [Bacilli bacterium]|nr:DUF5011 domain-containing protein [Bacilli bacterium]
MKRIKHKKNKLKIFIIIISIITILSLLGIGGYFYYDKVILEKISPIKLSLIGNENITIEFGDTYTDEGAKASFRDKDISKSIKVTNNINYEKIGTYKITYTISTKKKSKDKKRIINIVDTVKPEIKLKGNSVVTVYVGEEYVDPGFTSIDNYDGDITDKVISTNNINKEQTGTYEVTYKVSDSSGNEYETKRSVKYVDPFKPLPSLNAKATSIAVLNYHFFYDPKKGEGGGGSNFISVQDFEEELQYLKDNNYKTLTMDEFRRWMYGEIDLPARSVLITVDDGAQGTGKHNGNKLIPLLEKYEAHATLFLITGWWNIGNYSSPYLDIESHSHDLHHENVCSGVSRGAKILCISDEEVLEDLRRSIAVTGSTNAFCYPFYVYNQHTIELVQEAGFKLGFVGGDYKATRSSNKYKIPRYHIYKGTSLARFNNMIA